MYDLENFPKLTLQRLHPRPHSELPFELLLNNLRMNCCHRCRRLKQMAVNENNGPWNVNRCSHYEKY